MDPTKEASVAQVSNQKEVDTRKAILASPSVRAEVQGVKPRRDGERGSPFYGIEIFDFGINVLNNVNVAWCLCGYCIPMSTHIELVCCREIAGLSGPADRCLHDPRLTTTAVNVGSIGQLSMCDLSADSFVRPIDSR